MDSESRIMVWLRTHFHRKPRGQGILEFALILPLLLLLLYGIVEFGRLIFIYASVVTASREGARFGAASGGIGSSLPNFQDCEGIRDAARRAAILMDLSDDQIEISYDRMSLITDEFETFSAVCPPPRSVQLGDRIIVRVAADFSPIVPLVNVPPYTIESITRRTILRNIYLGQGGAPGGEYDPPVVNFAAAESEISEEAGTIYVQVILNSIGTSLITVPYTVSGTATNGQDYTILSTGDIVIPAGVPTADIPIRLIGGLVDGIDEPNETIILTMGTPTGATLGHPSVHTLTILDDDKPPTVKFLLGSDIVYEATVIKPVAVVLSGKSGYAIEVSYVVGGTATLVDDFSVTSTNPLVIPPMTTGANIILMLVQDGLDEDDETVSLGITGVTNAYLGIPSTHYLTIHDSDPPPFIYFTQNTQRAPEGVTAKVIAQLNTVTTRTVKVPYTVTSETADESDYNLQPMPPSTTSYIEIPPGSLEATLSFKLIKESPDVEEEDETIVIQMGLPVEDSATLGSPNEHLLTIGPVEKPIVYFQVPNMERGETTGQTNIVVELSNAWDQNVQVPFYVDDPSSTATEGQDFTILTASPLVIPAGSTYGNILVELTTDLSDEDNETAYFKLDTPTNGVLDPDRDVHVLTIIDDDELPTVQFKVAASSVDESEGTIDLVMELSSPSSKDITVPFSVDAVASTATFGATEDYTYAPSTKVVTIPPGDTSAMITVTVYDDVGNDPRGEPDETAIFLLGAPTNASLGTNKKHTLTIIEDEACPINYSVVAIGSKVALDFEYQDLDSPLELSAIRFDFADTTVARGLWEVWQNTADNTTVLIFNEPSGALTGSYIKVPDALMGYDWIYTPPIQPFTKLQFIFTFPLVEGYEMSLSLAFDEGCSKVLRFTP